MSQEAYYGHLVLRLVGYLVLFYTFQGHCQVNERRAEQGCRVECLSHFEATLSPQVGRLRLKTQPNTSRVEGILPPAS